MTTILEAAKIQIKEARESAYLGKYAEAIKKYQVQLDQITAQSKKVQNDQILGQEWSRLANDIKEELEITSTLQNFLRGNTQASPTKAKVHECPEFQEERQPKLPFNQLPFQHHKFPQVQYSPPKRDTIQYSPPRPQKQNPAQDADDNFQGNLRNYDNRPKTSNKDPDVWEPPSKPSQKKKPSQKQYPQKNSNPFKPPAQQAPAPAPAAKNRAYDKPWQNNALDPKKQENKKQTFHDFCYPDGRGPDSDLIQALEKEIVDLNPNVQFEDIAELDAAKEALQEAVLLPILMPQFFTGIRRPLKGVLLFGPPGTGKTMLAKAVATIGKTTFFSVTAASLASKWKGDAEKLVRILFEMARFYAPTTIFIDEIDSLVSKRGDNDGDSARKVKTQILTEMDGISSQTGEDRKTIMCLAATNKPQDLDEALIRRLERRIYIPLPSEVGRRALFKINLREIKVSEKIDWDYLIKKCDGYSGADIANVCREASMLPMRRKLKEEGGIQKLRENYQDIKDQIDVPLEQKDFEEALKYIPKSVANEYLKQYEAWIKEFGNN